jgi:ADP-heptose:LPS heptosyltransferase
VDDSGPAPLHAAAQLARPLESLALYLDRDRPWVSLGLPGPAPGPPYRIAVHPGSGSPRKNWGYERWADTLGRLHDALGPDVSFLVVSGEAEAGTIREFLALLGARAIPHDHLESAPLPDLARALAACHLFLGHDSGISHLAAAAEVPGLLLFGPTDPAVWAPAHPSVVPLRAPSGHLAALFPEELASRSLERLRGLQSAPADP